MPRNKTIPRATPRRRSKAAAVEEWLGGDEAPRSEEEARPRGRPKSSRPERKPMTVYVPGTLHKRAKRRALEDERELSEIVAEALEAFLAA